MLVIYIDKQTNRLGYTINLIFKEMLKVDYMVTTSRDQFIAMPGAKLSYCANKIFDELHITSSKLLFETNIASVDVNYAFEDGVHKIFKTYDKEDSFGFDVFASVFYMVSRYEEYQPFIRDKHSRFCATDSIAFKKAFADKPVVNIWVRFLRDKLQERYPDLQFCDNKFSFVNTIDVDMAYSYKGKGFIRNTGGFFRDLKNGKLAECSRRMKTLVGFKKDPYDCFDYILGTMTQNKLKTIFFILFGMRTEYDKNISPYNTRFRMLIKMLSDFSVIGIHPSYFSIEYPNDIKVQIRHLSEVIHKSVTYSRFHYLRFRLPQSYRDLADNGITDDYSMGYADQIGFRAGICTPYNFYDLEKDCETKLRIHPFMFMDVALKNGLKLSSDGAWQKIKALIDEVVAVGGQMISIWHNESLSDTDGWQGWRDVYKKQVNYISEITTNGSDK